MVLSVRNIAQYLKREFAIGKQLWNNYQFYSSLIYYLPLGCHQGRLSYTRRFNCWQNVLAHLLLNHWQKHTLANIFHVVAWWKRTMRSFVYSILPLLLESVKLSDALEERKWELVFWQASPAVRCWMRKENNAATEEKTQENCTKTTLAYAKHMLFRQISKCSSSAIYLFVLILTLFPVALGTKRLSPHYFTIFAPENLYSGRSKWERKSVKEELAWNCQAPHQWPISIGFPYLAPSKSNTMNKSVGQ